MSHRHWDLECKVYIGGLKEDANRYDLEDVFSKYGPVRDVWVARKPPGFAFVEMEDPRDAEDAVKSLDGSRVCGTRVKVEMSNGGKSRGRRRSRSRSRSRSRGRYNRRRSRSRSRRRSPSYRSTSRERKRSPVRQRSRSRSRS